MEIDVTPGERLKLIRLSRELRREQRTVAADLLLDLASRANGDEPEPDACASPTCDFAPAFRVPVKRKGSEREVLLCRLHLNLIAYHPYHQGVLGVRAGDATALAPGG